MTVWETSSDHKDISVVASFPPPHDLQRSGPSTGVSLRLPIKQKDTAGRLPSLLPRDFGELDVRPERTAFGGARNPDNPVNS